jgi:hypothetical protein
VSLPPTRPPKLGDRAAELIERLRRRRGAAAVPPQTGAPVMAVGPSELMERHDRLAEQFVELQWDLGGMAYEMASRDHFRVDVLTRHAARLQELDAELGEVERLLALEEAGAAGHCPDCGSMHARGAAFCAQCGRPLLAQGSTNGHS